MSVKNCALASLALSIALSASASSARAANDGLITKPSNYSVRDTVMRFEAAVKQKEAGGFVVFTEIDHAAAAKKFGLEMRPRTVIVFGNPKLGTPAMVKTPLLAIGVPPKALVWRTIKARSGCRIIPPTISTARSTRGTARQSLRRPRHSQSFWTK